MCQFSAFSVVSLILIFICSLDIEMVDLAEQMPVQQPQNTIPSTKVATVEAVERVSLFYTVSTKPSDFKVTFFSLIFEKLFFRFDPRFAKLLTFCCSAKLE